MEREAFGSAELEGDAFKAPGFVVKNFDVVLGVADGGDALEVGGGVADVLMSSAVEGRDGGWTEAEVVVSNPVAFVVAGAFSGEGVVGGFVMFVARRGEHFFGEGEHVGIELGVVLVVAGLELFKEVGVLLVGEVVGGEVIGLEGEGLGEGVFPIEEGLAGDGEDEVEIDLERGCFAKEVDGGDGLHGGVLAAEGFEVWSKEGLHAEGDAGDAEVLVELGGAGGESGGVGFEGDFLNGGEVEDLAEAGEETSKVSGRKHGGGAAAEVDGFERGKVFLSGEAGFGKEGFDEGSEVGFSGCVLVERAVGADAMAERDVEIKMHRLVVEEILREDREVVKQSGLNTKVLKDVSRSFYLSLRFLPKGFRAPMSVGYLLARASDTIADAGELSVGERKVALWNFRKAVLEGADFVGPEMKSLPVGEEVLMGRIGECLGALDELATEQKESVRKVVRIITDGQAWDLDRFEGDGVVCLESDEELREYAYQVAGCVGEFWTEVGFGVDKGFASLGFGEMNELGRAYGRSLQLINILRDVPEDLENGRCYLPGAESREDMMRERDRWILEAREGLDMADRYAEALNGKRMRFGTVLPAMIGRETLERLEAASWDDWVGRVKVTRKEVYGMMGRAVRFAV